MVRIVDNKGQLKMTIPKEIALEKRWKAGTILRFVEDTDGNIILREVVKDDNQQS